MNDEQTKYEYIDTYVDDLVVVANDPIKYLEAIKKEYPIRNIEANPEYYSGNDVNIRLNNTIRISSKKYITEVIRKYKEKYRPLKNEKITERGYIVDHRDPIVNIEYKRIVPDVGN